jgi:hypothetical protein
VHPPRFVAFKDPWYPDAVAEDLDAVAVTDSDWDPDQYHDYFFTAPNLSSDEGGLLRYWFVKISRDTDVDFGFTGCNAPVTTWLSYHTTLTYLQPGLLNVYAGLDDDPDAQDNMRIHTGFDAGGLLADPPAGSSVELDFDTTDQADLTGYAALQGYYTDQAFVSFWEIDEEALLNCWTGGLGGCTGIDDLAGFERGREGQETYADGGNPDSADYYYVLYYRLCHFAGDQECWDDLP